MKTDVTGAFLMLQFLRFTTSILVGVLLVKSGFSKEEVGTFEWFLLLISMVSFFWSSGLKNALGTASPDLPLSQKKKLYFNVSMLFFLLGILFGAVAAYFMIDYGYMWALLVGLSVLFGVPGSLVEQFFIVDGHSEKLFYYGLITYLGYFVLILVAILGGDSLVVVGYAVMIWAILKFLYLLYFIHHYTTVDLDFRLIIPFLTLGFPLVIHQLLGQGMDYVDGVIVKHFFSDGQFALYRYGARELPVNTIIIAAITTTMIPLVMVNPQKTMVEVKERISKIMGKLFLLSGLLIFLSPYIFRWVYSNDFIASAKIFNIYLLILCSRVLLPQLVIYANKKNYVLMIVAFIELLINISLSLFLLPRYGLEGIAAATVVAFYLQKIILAGYVWQKWRVPPGDYIPLKKYFLYTGILYLCYFVFS